MKKIFIFLVISIFLLMGVKNTYAAKPTDPISGLVYELQAKVEDLLSRVIALEQEFLGLNKYYTKDFGPYNASVGSAITILYGCNEADVAISGGVSEYQGVISNWRTVRNVPADAEYNNHAWETTVINEVENGSFSLRVKCLDLD